MTTIACISDTHGHFPELDLDGIDIILHAGDYTGMFDRNDIVSQLVFFENQFCPWVRRILDTGTQFYYISGNHEVFVEKLNIDKDYNDVTKHCLDMRLLTLHSLDNTSVTCFGFPYTPTFGGWGFNRDDTEDDLGLVCEHIPDKVDILLTHGPPYGILDIVPGRTIYDHRKDDFVEIPPLHVGSKQILKRVKEIKPRYVISGHLHYNYGIEEVDGTTFVACPLVNDQYLLCRQPIIFDI